MKLDKHYHISDQVALDMAKKPKKDIYKWLYNLPIYRGIYVKIREEHLKKLTDDVKQLSPKPSKSKPSGNTGADAKDNPERSNNKEGED